MSQLLSKNYRLASSVLKPMVQLRVDNSNSKISSTPEYLYLLRRAALNGLNYYQAFLATEPDLALRFWEGLYDFAAERR